MLLACAGRASLLQKIAKNAKKELHSFLESLEFLEALRSLRPSVKNPHFSVTLTKPLGAICWLGEGIASSANPELDFGISHWLITCSLATQAPQI